MIEDCSVVYLLIGLKIGRHKMALNGPDSLQKCSFNWSVDGRFIEKVDKELLLPHVEQKLSRFDTAAATSVSEVAAD